MIHKVFLIILFLVLFLVEPAKYSHINSHKLIAYAIFYILGIFAHMNLNKIPNWFRLDILFLLSIFISFYILPFTISIYKFIPSFQFYGTSYINYINYGTWMVSSAMLAWIIGYNFFLNNRKFVNKNNIFKVRYTYKLTLYLSFVLFAILLFLIKENIITRHYNGVVDWSVAARYAYALFSLTILVTTIFIFIHYRNDLKRNIFYLFKLDKIYLLVVSSYTFVFLAIIGDRGSFLQLFSAIFFIYSSIVKPMSLKKLLLIVLSGSILLTIIGLGRNSSEDILTKGFSSLGESYNSKSKPIIYTTTQDLAGTARIFYKSLEHIPKHHDYYYGKTMTLNILSLVPFLNGIAFDLFDLNKRDPAYNTADYITFLIQGKHPHWGEGSNIFADIYINFGYLGVILFMFILGMIFKKVNNEVILFNDIKYIIIATVLSTYVIYWPRASFLEPLKPILWAMLLYYLFVEKRKAEDYEIK